MSLKCTNSESHLLDPLPLTDSRSFQKRLRVSLLLPHLTFFVAVYPNGTVIKRVTACKYAKYEYADTETGLCLSSYCARSNLFCPKPEPLYKVPAALTKRGLEVGESLVFKFLWCK